MSLLLHLLEKRVPLLLLSDPAVQKLCMPDPMCQLDLCLVANSRVGSLLLLHGDGNGDGNMLPVVWTKGIDGPIIFALVLVPTPVGFTSSRSYPFGAVGLKERGELLNEVCCLVEEFLFGLGLQTIWDIPPWPVKDVQDFTGVSAATGHVFLSCGFFLLIPVW